MPQESESQERQTLSSPARPHLANRSTNTIQIITAAPTAGTKTGTGNKSRAGRDLLASIAVGVSIGAVVIALLFAPYWVFVLFVVVAALSAEWELSRALARAQIYVTALPLAIGTIGMIVTAYMLGAEALWTAFLITVGACALWRLMAGRSGHAVRDLIGTVLVAVYLGFLAGFVVMMLRIPMHPWPLVMWVLVTISNDIGGYAVGVLFGKHPLAPKVSPAKSWEGFIGSVLMCSLVAGICLFLLGKPWWLGIAFGLFTAILATVGDLGESLMKRDLALKDMSNILPGHGGLMDRLDSLMMTVPAYFWVSFFLWPAY